MASKAATVAASKVTLPEVLDVAAAEPLRTEILGHRGTPLEIDGQAVQRVGVLCLQVLLSARSSWAADQQPLTFTGRSAVLREALTTIGAHAMAAELPEEIPS